MQNLTIDTGVQEFSVNGRGVLRFNPGDPNVYHRFFAAKEPLAQLDEELTAAPWRGNPSPRRTGPSGCWR